MLLALRARATPSLASAYEQARLLSACVGVTGFEPATSSSRTKRATKLRHTPRCEERVPHESCSCRHLFRMPTGCAPADGWRAFLVDAASAAGCPAASDSLPHRLPASPIFVPPELSGRADMTTGRSGLPAAKLRRPLGRVPAQPRGGGYCKCRCCVLSGERSYAAAVRRRHRVRVGLVSTLRSFRATTRAPSPPRRQVLASCGWLTRCECRAGLRHLPLTYTGLPLPRRPFWSEPSRLHHCEPAGRPAPTAKLPKTRQ